jgi:hypothetical protein
VGNRQTHKEARQMNAEMAQIEKQFMSTKNSEEKLALFDLLMKLKGQEEKAIIDATYNKENN